MKPEFQTIALIASALNEDKRVFIPKIVGGTPSDMVMVEIFSTDQINCFPKSKWGIPEPELSEGQKDGTHLGVIDLVIVPGVAFDSSCGRIGHGKGYYGTTLFCFALSCSVLLCFFLS